MRYLIFVAIAPLLLAACSGAEPIVDTTSGGAADAASGVRTIMPANDFATYTPRVAMDPAPWRQSNDARSPNAGGTN